MNGVQTVEAKPRQNGMFDSGKCIGGISLETHETVRDLGMMLDCNLSMKEQIQRSG